MLEAPGFLLVDGGVADGSRADSSGERWALEYSNGPQTLQFQAYAEGSTYGSIVRALPTTGSITIDGVEATIRSGPGEAAGAAAEWSEGGLIVTFGGGPLSEAELREFVTQVRRVSRADWDTAVASIPTVTASTDTTRLR